MDIPAWLWNYAEEVVKKYDFDSSHDMTHFINVYNYAKKIIEEDYSGEKYSEYYLGKNSGEKEEKEENYSGGKNSGEKEEKEENYSGGKNSGKKTEKEKEVKSIIKGISREDSLGILYHAAFSHDLIDSKYVDSKIAIEELRNIFLLNGYKKEYLDIIIFLIDNMSYSKQRTGKIKIPQEYQLIMDIVSDADKLDAYRPERVVAYQENKNKNLKYDQQIIKNWIKTILVKRVLTYRDGWLKTSYAKNIAVYMHAEVEQYVTNNLADSEMYDY